MDKKRKLIYFGIGTVGISTGLLTILLYRNYLYKKAEAEVEQADKEKYLEDLDSDRGYGLLSGIISKRFKVLEKTGETDIRQAGRRMRASGSVYMVMSFEQLAHIQREEDLVGYVLYLYQKGEFLLQKKRKQREKRWRELFKLL